MRVPRIGIIGCGAAALRYYVPAFKSFPEISRNLFLVDKNPDQAKKLSELFGTRNITDDHTKILGEVDGVIVSLPHFLHYPVAVDFLNAGVHVLCEKPLAETPSEAAGMSEASRKHNVFLCVNNTRRMFPASNEIKRILSRGELGNLRAIRYFEGNAMDWPSSTGFYVDPKVSSKGLLLDLGPHVLDLVCWWLGGKPTLNDYHDDSYGGPESVLRIKAESNGCTIDVFLNRLNEIRSAFRIEGDLGSIEGEPFGWGKLKIESVKGRAEIRRLPTTAGTYPEFVKPIVENFIGVVLGRETPLISGEDVRASIEMIDDCYRARSRFVLPWYSGFPKSDAPAAGKTLVTGATGFIGGRLVEILHFRNARAVRAGVRNWSSAARIGRLPVEFARLDIMNREEIARALDGVTEVIHCAKGSGEVSVRGTRNLAEIALEKGVRRFVHMSTTEIYGDVTGKIDESFGFKYTGEEYNRTKIEAEKVCWEYRGKGLPLVVLRPSIVYGPFSNNWSVRLAKILLSGSWGGDRASCDAKCNLVFVDDLVEAILTSLENDLAVGEAFNIAGPEVITWNAYFRKYNEMLGLPPFKAASKVRANLRRAAMTPVRFAGGIVRDHFMEPVRKIANSFDLAKTLMKGAERAIRATPDGEDLRLFSRDAEFSIEKAKTMLGFSPSIPVAVGMMHTVCWLRHQGILPESNAETQTFTSAGAASDS